MNPAPGISAIGGLVTCRLSTRFDPAPGLDQASSTGLRGPRDGSNRKPLRFRSVCRCTAVRTLFLRKLRDVATWQEPTPWCDDPIAPTTN
jgi:hypothetical protein